MNWNRIVRQGHRWISLAFTVTVIANIIVAAMDREVDWLYLVPLAPLFLLMISGVYLFVLPYVARPRGARAPAEEV
jgi:hypothetical protein